MKNNALLIVILFFSLFGFSQSYQFKTIIDLETTDVISQGNTGTCWSFSASSFLESEIIRLTGKRIDISEMYSVRHTYHKKAWIYIMRQGKTQFSQGGLAHDVINSVSTNGLVPNYVFSGLTENQKNHNHSKMIDTLKQTLNKFIKNPKGYPSKWSDDVEVILDQHLGKSVTSFNYEGVQHTPKSFLKMTTINPEDYISITSFMHQPYNSSFILNIPDNFSNGSFYNVELDDMISILNNALYNGFTIELDCDVSEKTFSAKHGIAVIPENDKIKAEAIISIRPEKNITAKYRQQEFENYNTTDDHLMHITGLLKDQNGTSYYKVKNSWGNDSSRVANEGYVYISEAYMKLKTISIMIHKDALPKDVKIKLDLN